MKDFIEFQGVEGFVWIRVDKIVAFYPHKFRYMDGNGYHDANGSIIQTDSDRPGELGFIVFERPSEVMAKIEAAHASQP